MFDEYVKAIKSLREQTESSNAAFSTPAFDVDPMAGSFNEDDDEADSELPPNLMTLGGQHAGSSTRSHNEPHQGAVEQAAAVRSEANAAAAREDALSPEANFDADDANFEPRGQQRPEDRDFPQNSPGPGNYSIFPGQTQQLTAVPPLTTGSTFFPGPPQYAVPHHFQPHFQPQEPFFWAQAPQFLPQWHSAQQPLWLAPSQPRPPHSQRLPISHPVVIPVPPPPPPTQEQQPQNSKKRGPKACIRCDFVFENSCRLSWRSICLKYHWNFPFIF